MSESETQFASANRLYNARASSYDESWHIDFTKRFTAQLLLKPGDKVLDLACGTGLSTFATYERIEGESPDGQEGNVIGIDASTGMLAEASAKLQTIPSEKTPRISFHNHDVLSLNTFATVQSENFGNFDAITCISAFVLFPDPDAALKHWATYLKPGGFIAVDSTQPQNLITGTVLERTARKLGISIPYNRQWSQSENALRDVFIKAGLEVDTISNIHFSGAGTTYHSPDAATAAKHWSTLLASPVSRAFHDAEERSPGTLQRAREVFIQEWTSLPKNAQGQIEELDAGWLGVARKSDRSGSPSFTGGCRCSGVRYEAYDLPTHFDTCHCFTCGRLSGAGNLPFIGVPKALLKYTSKASLKTVAFSKMATRTFCGECGSPISMEHQAAESVTGMVLGSVDLSSMVGDVPKMRNHIFVEEKCVWEALPDGGAGRFEGMPDTGW